MKIFGNIGRSRARTTNDHPVAPSNDLAVIFDDATREVVLASCSAIEDGDFTSLAPQDLIRTTRLLLDAPQQPPLVERISAWRASLGLGHGIDSSFLIVPDEFGERTRIYPLSADDAALDENSIVALLVNDADTNAVEADNHPLFDAPLDELACDISRLPDGSVALTEVPREAVERVARRLYDSTQAAKLLEALPAEHEPSLSLGAETPLRALLRFWIEERLVAGDELADDPTKFTALFAVTAAGAAIGKWSAGRGLFDELGERFNYGDPEAEGGTEDFFGDGELEGTFFQDAPSAPAPNAGAVDPAILAESIEFAIGKLAKKLASAKVEEIGFVGVEQIVWAASTDVAPEVRAQLRSFADASGISLIELAVPLEEAIATGLLLGSLAGLARSLSFVPVINLASDFRARADESSMVALNFEHAQASRSRFTAALSLITPFVLVAAVIFASWLDTKRVASAYAARRGAAEKETARLKPIAAARRSAEENFKWFTAYISQIIELRRRQGAAIGLYAELDGRWPLADDQTFYVSEMKTGAAGQVEIKGFTKHQESVTAFVNSLENASKLFTGVNYDFRQGALTSPTGSSTNAAVAATAVGATLPPPGVSAWSVRCIYQPLAVAGAAPPKPAAPAASSPNSPAGVTK